MKNSYKHDYPNAWTLWYNFSQSEEVEFIKLDEWCRQLSIGIGIIEYPSHYTVLMSYDEVSKEFGRFDTWFDALDAVVQEVFRLVESWNDEEIKELYEASKLLDTDETSKEGVLAHYNRMVMEMGDHYKDLLKGLAKGKEPDQDDLDRLDSIIIVALTCKRMLTE